VGRVLIIAYHFPPCTGSSGLLRSLKFSCFLPEFGWHPTVLTVHSRAFESVDARATGSIPEGIPIVRAFALDSKKHLGYRGSYLNWTALPDRWISWVFGAVPQGLLAIRKHKIEVIFSTFPVATAILTGYLLHRLSGKPWIVDLRDSMTEDNYPPDPRIRSIRRWIEQKAVKHASRVIFTAASTRRMYLERYPELTSEKCLLIANGYDEEDFSGLILADPGCVQQDRPLRLLHTGLIYPEERDPRPFFRAVARLKNEGRVSASSVQIAFRAPGSEDLYRQMLHDQGITDLIELQPHVPYRQALQECADADGLLLFQAANCDHQIPAKAYEYLRLRKPILALTTHTGDTAALLHEVGGATIVNLADEDDIYRRIPAFLQAIREGTHALPDTERIKRYARRNQAEQLARSLSEVMNPAIQPAAQKTESFVR
jgi:glycosyltransferase involved in cell wall biosynthesis